MPPFRALIALGLDRLPEVRISESADGRGTIGFGQPSPIFGRGAGFSSWTPSLDPVPQFLGIENAQAVFDVIQRAASAISQT